MILDQIMKSTEYRVAKEKISKGKIVQEMMGITYRSPYKLSHCFEKGKMGIIAEMKKASPSKGVFCEAYHITEIAKKYEKIDIQAVSILTEPQYFQGKIEDLKAARPYLNKPILRKDFIFDGFQIEEAYVNGADAVLLIARVLPKERLKQLLDLAHSFGMEALVEVHGEEELEKAYFSGAKIIGINNRNLQTFETSLETTERLMKYKENGKIYVSESGISSKEQLTYLMDLGISAVLMGETFMKQVTIENYIRELRDEK